MKEDFLNTAQAIAFTAADVAKDAFAVASDMAGKTKDAVVGKTNVLKEQYAMDKNYRLIGEWYVNEHSEDIPAEIADIVAAIEKSKEKIASFEKGEEE